MLEQSLEVDIRINHDPVEVVARPCDVSVEAHGAVVTDLSHCHPSVCWPLCRPVCWIRAPAQKRPHRRAAPDSTPPPRPSHAAAGLRPDKPAASTLAYAATQRNTALVPSGPLILAFSHQGRRDFPFPQSPFDFPQDERPPTDTWPLRHHPTLHYPVTRQRKPTTKTQAATEAPGGPCPRALQPGPTPQNGSKWYRMVRKSNFPSPNQSVSVMRRPFVLAMRRPFVLREIEGRTEGGGPKLSRNVPATQKWAVPAVQHLRPTLRSEPRQAANQLDTPMGQC